MKAKRKKRGSSKKKNPTSKCKKTSKKTGKKKIKKKRYAMRVSLKPLTGERTRKPVPFAVCDIETRDWIHFLVIGYHDGTCTKYFRSMAAFLKFVFKHVPDKFKIYAHFGGIFDFLFILKEAFACSDIAVDNMIQKGSGLLCFDLRYKGMTVTFYDSAALLPFGLARLTDAFDVAHKKLEWDHKSTKKVTKKLLKYLEHDLKGHYEVLKTFQSWPLIELAGAKSTMASQAVAVLRLFLSEPIEGLPMDNRQSDNEDIDGFVRKSYFGGRTEIFRPYFPRGNKTIKCYDVNSLYPTVMRDNEFPNEFLEFTDKYRPDDMGFYDAEVNVPEDMYIPPLPTVQRIGKADKLIFPVGRFKGRWSTIELEYARSVGVEIISTGRGAIFRNGGYIFRDFINELYAMRTTAKLKGDRVTDLLCKLLMNSTYGRMGLRRERENLVVDEGQDGLTPYCEIETDHGIIRLGTVEKLLETSFSNVALAAWVTSHARIFMHKWLLKCGRDVYYMDTDSIFTSLDLPSSEALGDMKCEYEAMEACFLLPKTYVVDGIGGKVDMKKVVMKGGFDKRKIMHFKVEDFQAFLSGEVGAIRKKLKEIKTVTSKEEAQGLLTFKTALKKGNLVTRAPASTRQIRSHYDKRIIFLEKNGFNTKPICISSST